MRAETPTTTGPPAKVLYFNRFADGLKVAGTGTYNDFYIGLVGATNPASGPGGLATGGMVGVDVEQVVAWDPDIILLGNFDGALPADVYASPAWAAITAVRESRVYKVPIGGYRWDPPSHESPLMWRWLAMLVHPTGPRFDLFGEIQRYYRLYYDRTPTPTQLKAMLWADANSHSAHYEQFHVS